MQIELPLRNNRALLQQIKAHEETLFPPQFHYPLEGWVQFAENPTAIMVALADSNAPDFVTHFACGCLVTKETYDAFLKGTVTEADFEWYQPVNTAQPLYFYFATAWRRAMPYADCLLPYIKEQLQQAQQLIGSFALVTSESGLGFAKRLGMQDAGRTHGYPLFFAARL